MRVLRWVLLACLAAAAAGAGAQRSSGNSQAAAKGTAAPTPASGSQTAINTTIPSYPDSTKGLEAFVKQMLKLEKEGKQQELEAYETSLALPDAAQWFRSVFGENLGKQMALMYVPLRADAEIHTADMLAAQLKAKRTYIQAVRFDDSCNPLATATEYPFLLLRVRPEYLYDVRFLGSSDATVWSYLAYVNGGFRYIGNMRKKELGMPQSAPPPAPQTRRVRLAGNVVAAKLVHQVLPEYPLQAKEQGIQGTVILHAIIAKDGSVKDLYLDEGQCLLTQAAMAAVQKWRYSPTMLYGAPVEIDTTIQVVFTLQR